MLEKQIGYSGFRAYVDVRRNLLDCLWLYRRETLVGSHTTRTMIKTLGPVATICRRLAVRQQIHEKSNNGVLALQHTTREAV